MNISYNWLRELAETALEPRELAERLTFAGLAVDAVRAAGDDFVLEFDLTSNRPDCLSHIGIAREVAALEGREARVPASRSIATEGQTQSFASVEIRDADLCPRYAARVVRGARIAPSPDWLARRLHAVGQRPINNVTDITNYVLLELGQPLHAFDLAKLAERRIIVRRAWAGEKLQTLDGVERELDEEMLVIADAARAVALAGVMGGEETEITSETRDVLLESAYFNPLSVRRTAAKLGMQTEAARRFERGADYEMVVRAQARAIELICELAGGTATADALDVYPQPLEPLTVTFRPERVAALTGLMVTPREARRILTSLGFVERMKFTQSEAEWSLRDGVVEVVTEDAGAGMAFVAPTWRTDIEREEDLVEEVARLTGYDKISAQIPVATTVGEYYPQELRRRATRSRLAAAGFDEAISYSFIDEAHDGRFATIFSLEKGQANEADGDEQGAPALVTLSNPVIEGVTRMRPTLLPGLLDAVRHNFNHGTRDTRLFELGRIFAAHEQAGERPHERASLALVLTGGATEADRAGAPRELDFYDLKGALEMAAEAMNLAPLDFAAASVKHLRAGQAALVYAQGQVVGSLGKLSEEVAALYKFRQAVFVAEADYDALLRAEEAAVRYRPLARFPATARDISLLSNRGTTLAEIRRAIFAVGLEYLRNVALVDVYEGANLPEGKRSVTLRLEYRADDRTLRDEDVDRMHARVVAALEQNLGAQQRI